MNREHEYVANSPSQLVAYTSVFNLTFKQMVDDKENLLYKLEVTCHGNDLKNQRYESWGFLQSYVLTTCYDHIFQQCPSDDITSTKGLSFLVFFCLSLLSFLWLTNFKWFHWYINMHLLRPMFFVPSNDLINTYLSICHKLSITILPNFPQCWRPSIIVLSWSFHYYNGSSNILVSSN